METSNLAAIIVAGGKATRLGGIAKHAIVVDGATILERLLGVLRPRCAEIVVAGNAPIAALDGIEAVSVVRDAVIDGGPLAGIAAGLAVVAAGWAIVVAGDMPFVGGAVIDRLVERIDRAIVNDEGNDHPDRAIVNDRVNYSIDAVAYRVDGRPEPLCCALRVAAARPVVDGLLAASRLRASGLLAALRVDWLDVAAGSEEARGFANLNSPGDLPPGSGI